VNDEIDVSDNQKRNPIQSEDFCRLNCDLPNLNRVSTVEASLSKMYSHQLHSAGIPTSEQRSQKRVQLHVLDGVPSD
jgi:hypothetical protein